MAAKPQKSPLAITKRPLQLSSTVISAITTSVKGSLGAIAQAFAGKGLSLELRAEAYTALQAIESAVEDTMTLAKAVIKHTIEEKGERITDKGSMALTIGSQVFSMRPTRTGTDPKKFESLLRSKGQDPTAFMDATISFKFNEAKAGLAVGQGVLTADELKTCEYEASFALQPPKRVGEV